MNLPGTIEDNKDYRPYFQGNLTFKVLFILSMFLIHCTEINAQFSGCCSGSICGTQLSTLSISSSDVTWDTINISAGEYVDFTPTVGGGKRWYMFSFCHGGGNSGVNGNWNTQLTLAEECVPSSWDIKGYDDDGCPSCPDSNGATITYAPQSICSHSVLVTRNNGSNCVMNSPSDAVLAYKGFSTAQADLTFDPSDNDLSISGTIVTIQMTVCNYGGLSAGAFRIGYYLSTNNVITITDQLLGYNIISGLSPGNCVNRVSAYDASSPCTPAGTYYIGFIIDYQHTVTEADESLVDNTWVACDQVTITGPATPSSITVNPNSPVCGDTSITLTVSPTDPGTNATWRWYEGGCGSGASIGSDYQITVIPSSTTSYYVKAVGCSGSSICISTTVEINPIPNTPSPVVSPSPTVCAGDSLMLNADTTAQQYTWSGPNGFSSALRNPSVNTNIYGTGDYCLVVTQSSCQSQQGCVHVTVNPSPSLSAGVSPETVCIPPGEVTFTASGADTYAWDGSGVNGQTGDTVHAAYASAGSYTVTVTGTSNGCTATANTTVSVDEVTVSISPDPASVCTGGCIDLTATANPSNSTYLWNTGDTTATIHVCPGTTTYSVTATHPNGICTVTDQRTVIEFPLPTAIAITQDSALCSGETTTLNGSGGVTCTWSPATYLDVAGSCSPTFGPAPDGQYAYTLTVTDTNNCTSTDEVDIDVTTEQPLSFFSTGNIAGCNVCFTNNSTGATSFKWDFGDDQQSTESNPCHEYCENENYVVVTLTAYNNCGAIIDSNEVQDTIELTTCVCLGIQASFNDFHNLNIFPNPTDGILNVEYELEQPGAVSLDLYTITGKKIYGIISDTNTQKNHYQISMRELNRQAGIYYLRIGGENGSVVKKVMLLY